MLTLRDPTAGYPTHQLYVNQYGGLFRGWGTSAKLMRGISRGWVSKG